jgi:hypothetical protein
LALPSAPAQARDLRVTKPNYRSSGRASSMGRPTNSHKIDEIYE